MGSRSRPATARATEGNVVSDRVSERLVRSRSIGGLRRCTLGRRTGAGDDRGLTLLELVAALSILAVLLGLAGLGMHELRRRWELAAATRQIVLDLRMARIGAIARARAHRLRFEVDGRRYWREVQDHSGDFIATAQARELPRAVTIAACTARGGAVSFRPRGNATSFGTISLLGSGGESRDIVVDMVGRVQVRR